MVKTIEQVEQEAQKQMDLALNHLKQELKSVRTGTANPALLEPVLVEVYGTQMRLKDLASITSPEPRQLLITPFDANNTPAIGKSIEKANLNLQAITEGNSIRINIPPMDEQLRKEMVKQCNKKKEDGKIRIRNIRREFNDLIKKQKNNGDLSEDLMKKTEKTIQELTDKYCKEMDTCASNKEKEILTI